LEVESHFLFRMSWTSVFLFYSSIVAGMTGIQHHTQLRWAGGGGLMNFFALYGLEPQPSWSQPLK
jgi:hypothetical protein